MRIRFKATAEIVIVWLLVVLGFKAFRVSLLGAWEDRVLGHYLLEYLLVLGTPLVWLLVTRRRLATHGFSRADGHNQVRTLVTGVPAMLSISAALHFLGWQRWENALLISALEVAILVALACLLRPRSAAVTGGAMFACVALAMAASRGSALASTGDTIVRLIYGLAFVALGEEALFRGYIQSRLNEAWGQPYKLWGVRWGWGAVLTAFLFGLWHVLNPWNPFIGVWNLAWLWGLWTAPLGLILGYVRERTGAIWVPVLLHWLINL